MTFPSRVHPIKRYLLLTCAFKRNRVWYAHLSTMYKVTLLALNITAVVSIIFEDFNKEKKLFYIIRLHYNTDSTADLLFSHTLLTDRNERYVYIILLQQNGSSQNLSFFLHYSMLHCVLMKQHRTADTVISKRDGFDCQTIALFLFNPFQFSGLTI